MKNPFEKTSIKLKEDAKFWRIVAIIFGSILFLHLITNL